MPADAMPGSRPAARCPLCRKPIRDEEYRPFCSRGCKDRDLLAWLGEGYRLPVPPAAEEDERDG